MPSHQHVLISDFLWAIIDRSMTKGDVYCRKGGGERIQTKQGLVEPPSPPVSEGLGGKLQASFSFHCIRVCLLMGAGWPRAETCSADVFLRKNMHHRQVVVLKGIGSLKKKGRRALPKEGFLKGFKCFIVSFGRF